MTNEDGNCWLVQEFIEEAFSKAITHDELVALEIKGPGRPRTKEKKQRKQGPALRIARMGSTSIRGSQGGIASLWAGEP